MITFISRCHNARGGSRYLEYDVNITTAEGKRKTCSNTVRIGFRNHCADRIKSETVALAFDEDQKKLYIIPKNTIPAGLESTVKCYTVCNHATAGCCVKATSNLLYQFIKDNNLEGLHELERDAQTGWFVISVK